MNRPLDMTGAFPTPRPADALEAVTVALGALETALELCDEAPHLLPPCKETAARACRLAYSAGVVLQRLSARLHQHQMRDDLPATSRQAQLI